MARVAIAVVSQSLVSVGSALPVFETPPDDFASTFFTNKSSQGGPGSALQLNETSHCQPHAGMWRKEGQEPASHGTAAAHPNTSTSPTFGWPCWSCGSSAPLRDGVRAARLSDGRPWRGGDSHPQTGQALGIHTPTATCRRSDFVANDA